MGNNVYRTAREINLSLERSLAEFSRFVAAKCDWKDADDVTFWKKCERRKKRRKILDELVPDRKCPCCKETRIGPGEWMVRMDGAVILCRSCYARLKPKGQSVTVSCFVKEPRWRLDGKALRQARMDIGLSQQRFGALIGVSAARVHQLEEHTRSVSDEQKNDIQRALESLGCTFIGD